MSAKIAIQIDNEPAPQIHSPARYEEEGLGRDMVGVLYIYEASNLTLALALEGIR